MKVGIIQHFSVIKNNECCSNVIYTKGEFNKGLTSDVFIKSKNVSFQGNTENGLVDDELSYERFMARYREAYGDKPINEVITSVINNNEELNRGHEKRVFIFPEIEDFLIAHLYKQPHIDKDLPIEKCYIKYPKYNLGQPIAQNGYDILIMKRIPGVPNSVNNLYAVIKYICKNDCATKEMAQEYLSKLRIFKDFPQESYNNLARQIEYLWDKDQTIDSVNCNNLLIDVNNKKFHLIDLPDSFIESIVINLSKLMCGMKHGVYDMISLLLDPRFQCCYLEQMSPKEQQETKNISENVIKKCFIAAKGISLSLKTDMLSKIYQFTQNTLIPTLGKNFSRRYVEFLNLYKI